MTSRNQEDIMPNSIWSILIFEDDDSLVPCIEREKGHSWMVGAEGRQSPLPSEGS